MPPPETWLISLDFSKNNFLKKREENKKEEKKEKKKNSNKEAHTPVRNLYP